MFANYWSHQIQRFTIECFPVQFRRPIGWLSPSWWSQFNFNQIYICFNSHLSEYLRCWFLYRRFITWLRSISLTILKVLHLAITGMEFWNYIIHSTLASPTLIFNLPLTMTYASNTSPHFMSWGHQMNQKCHISWWELTITSIAIHFVYKWWLIN